ncbi:amidase signature domain-containing protein [Suillus paluster]|uniref:amidase signature domain-containing protein n=1 Tax=Suillus paluster TaxID=48578 RepID=UPI001B886DCD|nr:amidase signature domain-containing protein [Suillus paluster]KAG1754892.1 amidase signature domain-containing protein [Suillus paluster]
MVSVKIHDVAAQKRQEREAKLFAYREGRIHVPNDVVDLSQYLLTKLTETGACYHLVRKRVYTAQDVLRSFVKVAVAAQDVTNCLSEVFLDEAFLRAKELDQYLETTGNVIGPLHGLPVSIKDHIKIKGLDTSSGYLGWAYKTVADSDGLVVEILRNAGAILYVKTQNPQTLLSLETDNNVFGRTVNPFNRNLTPGGSSGGEGALIACHGSPMGVGTDIGGSIRIPAAHCGLYGLKGSVARLPHSGLLGSHDGMDAIVGCVGPLATSARDLELFCRVMLDAKPWLDEPPLLEMPWKRAMANGEGLPEKLAIAILFDDGVVAPHPPIMQALDQYKDALVRAGHDVIEWHALDHQNGWDLIAKLYLLDGGAEYHETIRAGGEFEVPQTEWILKHAQGRDSYTPAKIFKLNLEREAFRSKALAHWNATHQHTVSGRPVDVILCPVAPTLAPPHDTTRWWGYTSHWNLLDLPGVVFPVGRFKATPSATYPPLLPSRNDVENFIHGQWNPATYDNAPISLQLVGRRHNEEKLLAMLNVVEEAFRENARQGVRS